LGPQRQEWQEIQLISISRYGTNAKQNCKTKTEFQLPITEKIKAWLKLVFVLFDLISRPGKYSVAGCQNMTTMMKLSYFLLIKTPTKPGRDRG